MNQTYSVGLLGLGAIAHGYGSPDEVAPYCHAGGIMQCDRVSLAVAADLNPAARAKFSDNWGTVFPDALVASSSEELLAARPDIVAICVRGPYHFPVARELLEDERRPRALFLEKPPTCSLREMDELSALAKSHDVPLVVSYSRHWAPHVLRLQELVREGIVGGVHTVVGFGGGLVLSSTSHTTDLLCQFAGSYEPRAVSATGTPNQNEVPPDWLARGYEAEPLLQNMHIEFANGVVGLQVGGRGEAGEFYVDVWGDAGRVRAGMYVAPEAFSLKGNALDLSSHRFPPEASPFQAAYAQIAAFLDGGELPHCTNDQAVAVHEIGIGAIESMAQDGARIALPNAQRERKIYANG